MVIKENKIYRAYKRTLLFFSVLLFILPAISFPNKGFYDLFFYNIGYYSLFFLLFYFGTVHSFKRFGFKYEVVNLKIIFLIIFEILCISQFVVSKYKINGSIDNINKTFTSASGSNVTPPSVSFGTSPLSRRSELIEKLSYLIAKVREKNSVNIIRYKTEEDILIVQLRENFTPVNLLKTDGIANANDTINRFEELVLNKKKLIDEFYSQMDEEFEKLNISSGGLQEARIGEKKGKETFNRIYDVQLSELRLYKEILNLINKNFSQIKIDNNKFTFASNDTLFEFNNLVNKLSGFSEIESKLISNEQNSFNGFLKTLNYEKI